MPIMLQHSESVQLHHQRSASSDMSVSEAHTYKCMRVLGSRIIILVFVSLVVFPGAKGAATASQTQSQITSSALTFTKPETFDGGSTTAVDDTLASVIVDDRNLSTISSTSLAMALQWGGNYDQSWRVVIAGASGESQGSSFQIQVRLGGVWQTKSAFYAT